jgi:undecaprenyl-diphosphatase
VVIYFDKLNPFKPGKTARQIQLTWQLWAKVVVAALPAAIIGFFLDDWFEAHFYNLVSVAIMLIIYGAAFIYLEKREQVEPTVTELSRLPYQTALYIGLFQVLSLFPGTSRSGATIVGGLLNGVSRPVVTEFTFYLGIPIMFGASGLKILKFIIKGNSLGFDQLFLLLVAMGVAFGVSLYVIRFLTDYVKNHDFTIFGKYRIGLGVLLLVYGLIKVIIG